MPISWSLCNLLRLVSDLHQHLNRPSSLPLVRAKVIYDEVRGKENLCIRTRHDADARVRAFFTYPASAFVLEQESAPSQARYVEYLPGSIHLRYLPHNIVLEIALDLYETLMRIRDGYVPAAGEMQAFFLNLLMFKKQLMSTPSERLLLTSTDYTFYQMARTSTNGVALSILS